MMRYQVTRGFRGPVTAVVLTCPFGATVGYESQLRQRGFEAWTPLHWVSRRLPRCRTRVWELRPLLGGFLFLPLSAVEAFLQLPYPFGDGLDRPAYCKPMFVGYLDPELTVPRSPKVRAIVGVSDASLSTLRDLDNRRADPDQLAPDLQDYRETFPPGTPVRIIEGLLRDVEGKVEGHRPGQLVVIAVNFSPIPVIISGSQIEKTAI